MVDKLEACPFCGGEASLIIPSEHVQADCADIYVSCDECEAEGQHFVVEMQDRTPDRWPYEQRDAIAAWNTRATPANGEQVERAKAAVNALDWDSVYKAARKRTLNDATGTFYDEHLAREVADRIAATLSTPTEDARERVKEALAWRTIESAPKDGSRFLGWDEELGVRTMWWDAHFESDGWDEEKDAPKYREAWNAGRVQSWGHEEYYEEHPTHWLPSLPGPALGNKETDRHG